MAQASGGGRRSMGIKRRTSGGSGVGGSERRYKQAGGRGRTGHNGYRMI